MGYLKDKRGRRLDARPMMGTHEGRILRPVNPAAIMATPPIATQQTGSSALTTPVTHYALRQIAVNTVSDSPTVTRHSSSLTKFRPGDVGRRTSATSSTSVTPGWMITAVAEMASRPPCLHPPPRRTAGSASGSTVCRRSSSSSGTLRSAWRRSPHPATCASEPLTRPARGLVTTTKSAASTSGRSSSSSCTGTDRGRPSRCGSTKARASEPQLRPRTLSRPRRAATTCSSTWERSRSVKSVSRSQTTSRSTG